MTDILVSGASELGLALATAQAGDTVRLTSGDYGDFAISAKTFASAITITSLDPFNPASFHSLSVNSSQGIHFDNIRVNFVPVASTVSFSAAVRFNSSSDLTLIRSTIVGGPAVTGVAEDATVLDSSGNVIGRPTGYALNIVNSSNVIIAGDNISNTSSGIVFSEVNNILISGNEIHDLRKTGILGSGLHNVTVDSNYVHDSHPWHWGSGDHADFLAFWTYAGQTDPSDNIKITNNVFNQGAGTAVLGMWLQGGSQIFTNATISHNVFLDGNLQAIALWGVHGGTVDHNALFQTSGDVKAAPGILLNSDTQNITVTDNILSTVYDSPKSLSVPVNNIFNNHIVQKWLPNVDGFYYSSIVGRLLGVHDFATLYDTALSAISGASKDQMVADFLAAEDSALVSPAAGVSVTGNYLDERLAGTGGNDTLDGAGGNDTILGGNGDDVLTGGGGTNLIFGGAGNDTINSGAGSADGGAGDDVINGVTNGSTYLRGGDGNDVITSGTGFNDINGNAGNDTIFGGPANDWLVGGKGDDEIHGGTGKQILYGNLGNDTLIGGDHADTVRGGQGDDLIYGGGGNDWISGDKGNDTIYGGSGADIFHTFSGAGIDRVMDFNSAEGDRVLFDAGTTYTLSYLGGDTIIDMGNGDVMILVGVSQAKLGDWMVH